MRHITLRAITVPAIAFAAVLGLSAPTVFAMGDGGGSAGAGMSDGATSWQPFPPKGTTGTGDSSPIKSTTDAPAKKKDKLKK
jgi:hypothetical protein